MSRSDPVLIIGATGMLGRPVTRRLVKDGFNVRAMVRDEQRARTKFGGLPESCKLVRGDLRDPDSIRRAMTGVRAVYINLAVPMVRKPPTFDPELDGTRAVVNTARECGVEQIVRISALGVDGAASRWWVAKHKLDADDAVLESGLRAIVLRPTWLMESLPTCVIGPIAMNLPIEGSLRWIAGDDFAQHVSAVMRDPSRFKPIEISQGPEALTIREAMKRYRAAIGHPTIGLPLPLISLRLGSKFSGKAHYLFNLIEMTEREFAAGDRTRAPTDLPEATLRIEDYVRYMKATGDRPRK